MSINILSGSCAWRQTQPSAVFTDVHAPLPGVCTGAMQTPRTNGEAKESREQPRLVLRCLAPSGAA